MEIFNGNRIFLDKTVKCEYFHSNLSDFNGMFTADFSLLFPA